MKRRKLALVAAGLAAMALLPAAPALASTKPTTPAVQTPNGVKFNPGKATCKATSGSTKDCVEIERLPLSDLTATQQAQRRQAMAKLSAKAKQANATAAPAAAATAPAACGFSSSGVPTGVSAINPSRLLSCSDFFWTLLAVQEVDGVFSIIGNFPFEDQSWVTYSATKLNWTHNMQTITYAGGGTLADGVDGFMSSSCMALATICTATGTDAPDPQVVSLAPASTYNWEWDEQDTGAASTTTGTMDNLDTVLGVQWDLSVGTTDAVENETDGLDGRCDNGDTGNGSEGCVDEDFIPTLYLSYALYGASVDMVNFAEDNIPPYYGDEFSPTPTPLHRLASKTQQKANRKVICGEAVFTPDSTITAALAPYGDKDSCDEYPFAGTYESGAMQTGFDGQPKPFVTTGADCWQGTAVQSGSSGIEPADWNVILLDSTSTTQCMRAHIPKKLNTTLGGKYGNFVQKKRLLDKDAFWVYATP